MGSLLAQLATFMPWMDSLAQIVSFGGKTLTHDRCESFKEIYEFMRTRLEERAQSWIKGEPRDMSDAYRDKVDDTTDVNSSFHKSRKNIRFSCSLALEFGYFQSCRSRSMDFGSIALILCNFSDF